MYDIQKVLRLEEELRQIEKDLAAGKITEEKATSCHQLTEALLNIEKAKRVSQEILNWRVDI